MHKSKLHNKLIQKNFKQYDLVGFGSGIYGGKASQRLA